MTHELPAALITRIADELAKGLLNRSPGHCMRVDDFARDDARAVANELTRRSPDADVHVLSGDTVQHPAEVRVDRAIELRNREARPLLLLVPAGVGHAASSLDNSFEPLPLVSLLQAVSERLEKELGATEIGSLITSVRRALGRARRAESWARFLGTVSTAPTAGEVGRQLWQVGLVPDLGADGIESRLQRNAKAVAAIARPSRPTASVMDRLINADVSGGEFRQRLQAFLELQEAGRLADPVSWTRMLGEHHPGKFTFEQWPTAMTQASELTRIKITPFLRSNGALDSSSRLKLGEDGELYCDVTIDHPGQVHVKWATEPANPADVDSWQAEVLPPADLRSPDTSPIARTKIAGDKRKATLSVNATEDDLVTSTLFVVRLRAFDADGNELQLDDEAAAEAESDQFEVRHTEFEPPPAARSGAASLPLAVLGVAIDTGGALTEGTPVWDQSGQAFDIRIGKRRVLIRASRTIRDLQHAMAATPGKPMAFEARSPLGEPIPAGEIHQRPLTLPPTLANHRSKLLAALCARPRNAVEIVDWNADVDLSKQARDYVQAYARALTANRDNPEARSALLSVDTLSVSVTTADAEVTGLVLLPTHPLRLAWLAAHDRLLRGWAAAVAEAGKSKQDRARRVDHDMAARLSPANMPFIMATPDGKPLVYAEELTHGAALYLPPDVAEPQSAADTICRVLEIARASAEQAVSAQSLTERFRSYRAAHPGTGAMRALAVNPGTGAMLAQALRPLVLRQEASEDNEVLPDDPQRLEIIAYTGHRSYTDPVGDLRQLQRAVAAGEARRSATTHLAPPLGLAVRDLRQLDEDREGHHLAVVQDLARSRVTAPEAGDGRRADATTAFQDLLTPLVAERAADSPATWYVSPALKGRTEGLEADIINAHRAHQTAVAAHLGLATDASALQISLAAPDITWLQSAHQRADWVITLDRGIGPEIFEEAAPDPAAPTPYLLDYTPDFLEGLGKKLTVTTVHHDEVRRVLAAALRSLDLEQDQASVSRVLNYLSLVSGRLALRLLRDTSLSVEAVSLAAVMAHLSGRGQLEGLIVVPVDAHTEIFGVHQRAGEAQARRCDLLLVQVTQRSLRIECVEVKGRRTAQLPLGLADSIVDQLELTERLLQQQFFATDPPRIDSALQRARLAGLLHYYADRSARFGHITPAKLADIHINIDRHEKLVSPTITKTGYVISIDGIGFPNKHRDVPIRVLTPKELGAAGFTTLPGTRGQQAAHAAAPMRATPISSASRVVPAPASGTAATTSNDPNAIHSPKASEGASEVWNVALSPERAAQLPLSPDGALPTQAPVVPVPGGSTTSARVEEDHQGGTSRALPEEEAVHASSDRPVSVELGADGGGTPVAWNVSTKGSPHAFILGIPGQGKSVTTRRIIREFARQALPSLVLDFHGDMAAEPPVGAQVIDASAGLQFSPFELASLDPVSMKRTAWEVAEIIGYVCGLGDIQLRHVYNGLQRAYTAAQGVPIMAQFADAVEEVERETNGKNARDRLLPLTDFGLFADKPTGTFVDSWRNGAVVDLSGLGLESVQLAGGAFILRKIYREMFSWEQTGIMRLAIVLDEAHRLAKDVTLPKLMKEGRKYGVSLVVASQGMADFHRDVIANAGTKIVFRTNFPDSKATANFLRGRDGQDLSQQIEQLSVGSAYVSTPDHVNARRVYMHR